MKTFISNKEDQAVRKGFVKCKSCGHEILDLEIKIQQHWEGCSGRLFVQHFNIAKNHKMTFERFCTYLKSFVILNN
jgi:hypothetical protein